MRFLNDHPQIWTFAYRKGAGTRANVYRISDDKVVKFKSKERFLFPDKIQEDDRAVESLAGEYHALRSLHESGVPVPKPFGVFRVPLQTLRMPHTAFKAKFLPGIVMEYLDGILIRDAPKERRAELHARAVVEVEKAILKGFTPGSYNLYMNTLWVPETNQIYLMGFEYWNPKFINKPLEFPND